jgi:predicted RNA-binding protein with PUA-like domain
MLGGRCAGGPRRDGALVWCAQLPGTQLPDLRANDALGDLLVLLKGNRLSSTPVEPQHWRLISKLLGELEP